MAAGDLVVQDHGFNLHAKTHAGALDEPARARLLRYVLRPPLARKRLQRLPDHRVRLELKRPWSDGTYALEMDALALLSRLAASVSLRDLGPAHPAPASRGFAAPVAAPTATRRGLRRGVRLQLALAAPGHPATAARKRRLDRPGPAQARSHRHPLRLHQVGPAHASDLRPRCRPLSQLPGGFPPQICCRGAWQDETARARPRLAEH
jgi:hypothetical protein